MHKLDEKALAAVEAAIRATVATFGDESVSFAEIMESAFGDTSEQAAGIVVPALARAALAALPPEQSAAQQPATDAVDGWKLVPTPQGYSAGLTPEMFDAFWVAFVAAREKHGNFESVNAGYNAMLAAAPALSQSPAKPAGDA